ncbi:hypothetical protein KGP38_09680 [Lactococcus lactis]|uniref:hypothetical protein n=1 Tax=Lactococcus lactis TaxID=1358 RepID=UPI001C1F739B|nr:hypothetical protein [Lactococcus lactis]MBU7542863.1 hypothetical protein [Lactococcus lactis]
MVKTVDLSGQSFGRVTVVEKTSKRDKKGNVIWQCVCSCGNEKLISTRRLKSNKNISCGCYRREKVRESVTNISKARIDNESSGIRNIYYLPTKVLGTRTEAEEFKKNIIKQTEHEAIVYEIELVPVEDGE